MACLSIDFTTSTISSCSMITMKIQILFRSWCLIKSGMILQSISTSSHCLIVFEADMSEQIENPRRATEGFVLCGKLRNKAILVKHKWFLSLALPRTLICDAIIDGGLLPWKRIDRSPWISYFVDLWDWEVKIYEVEIDITYTSLHSGRILILNFCDVTNNCRTSST